MNIANISSSSSDKLLSTTSEEPPVGSKGAALFAKFSELLTTGAGAEQGGNPEHEKLTEGEAPNALKSDDQIDIFTFLGFVAALEDQMSKTLGDRGISASASERSGENIGLEDLAKPFISDPNFVITRDKLAQAMSASADALPAIEVAMRLDHAGTMVRTQHTAYPSEVVAHQLIPQFSVPAELLKGEAMPHKPIPGQLENVGSSKRESAPLESLLGQSGKALLGSGAPAVVGMKENGEQGIATPGRGTLMKGPEPGESVPKLLVAQTVDTQTDAKPHVRAMHQIPQVEPEKAFLLRQSGADGSSSADLETERKPDSGKFQLREGQQKEAVKLTNLLKPETALKPEQIALRTASESALAASGNNPAAPLKIKVALEASAPANATPIQKAVEAEFKLKADVKGIAVKSKKTSEQSEAAPVTGAAAAAPRQAAVAAITSEGGADTSQDLGALPHSISLLNSANPQLAQTQTAPQTSGQLLDKWVESHLDLNARGWTQTLARKVISALKTGQQQIALTLTPASLGKMHIAFGRNESGLDVKIQAERKATVSLFGESEGKIISSLETAGYRVTSLSCSVMNKSNENFNMNLGQGLNEQENPSGHQGPQTAQKNEQPAGKAADDGSLKGKDDQDGLVDITI